MDPGNVLKLKPVIWGEGSCIWFNLTPFNHSSGTIFAKWYNVKKSGLNLIGKKDGDIMPFFFLLGGKKVIKCIHYEWESIKIFYVCDNFQFQFKRLSM